ncbi:hypothetical protein EII17_03125 [Clostridiales bacterium COT073_COT-073]|nr:hypothetical protein EII17_03125 [Clostridiales bacterium COT073_COT-073]
MNEIIDILNNFAFLLAPVFYKLLAMSLTAACITAVILAVRRLIDQKITPLWKYILWAVMLAALLIPYRLPSDWAVLTSFDQVEQISFRQQYDKAKFQLEMIDQAEINTETNKKEAEFLQKQESNIYLKSLIADVILPLVWFAGAILMLLSLLIGRLWLEYQLQRHKLNADRYKPLLVECQQKIAVKGKMDLIVQDYLTSPAIIGFWKTKIILPAYSENLSPDSLAYVLLHELAHYKRKDMLVNYLLLLLQAVYWFNPLIWLAFRFIREDMELLNDNYVLDHIGRENSKAYSRSLVEVLAHSHNISLMPKLLCMVDGKKNVERRIRMISLNEKLKRRKWLIAGLCLVLILALSTLFLTQKEHDQIKWLKSLKPKDILQMEMVVHHGGPEKYYLFPEAEYEAMLTYLKGGHGKYIKNPEPLVGGGANIYLTTIEKEIHQIRNDGNTYLWIDEMAFQAGYDWLSKWPEEKATSSLPPNFHHGRKQAAFKGMELYVWQDNNRKTRYTLLPGTNRLKTEEEIYDRKSSLTSVKEVGAVLAQHMAGLDLFIIEMPIKPGNNDDLESLLNWETEREVFMHELWQYVPENTKISIGSYQSESNGNSGDQPVETEEPERMILKLDFAGENVLDKAFEDINRQENRGLTKDEIAEINLYFEQLVPSEDLDQEPVINPICHFFSSYYDTPEKLNLSEFLWYFPGVELNSNQPEDVKQFEQLKKLKDYPQKSAKSLDDTITPVRRKSRQAVDRILQRYAGIRTTDIINQDNVLYLKDYDSFYTYASDFGLGFFYCNGGRIENGKIILDSEYAILTIRYQDNHYLIESHMEK